MEEEERAEHVRREREAAALRMKQKVYRLIMVRIVVGSICHRCIPCFHGVLAFNACGESCFMGILSAPEIKSLLSWLGQSPNPHIDEQCSVMVQDTYKPRVPSSFLEYLVR